MEKSNFKSERILELYTKLLNDEIINKEEAAQEYRVDVRTIQRDIDTMRNFFSNQEIQGAETARVVYDRRKKGFRLEYGRKVNLTNAELFTVIKILLENRSLVKAELEPIIRQMIDACIPPAEKKLVEELIRNELFHYIGPRHGKKLVEQVWQLGEAVHKHQIVSMKYRRLDGTVLDKKVKPVGIMCSEYYFYVAGFEGESEKKHAGFPTIYRIDRIEDFKTTSEKFYIPDRDRFEEGEFRKRVPFMYSGPLTRVEFIYKGPDINAILDRLPTSEYQKLDDGGYRVQTEVYGKRGIEMWLKAQGEYVSY